MVYSQNIDGMDAKGLYVFNTGNGFVIVSADDCFVPILGYGTDGYFDADNMPDSMRYFLDEYCREMNAALNSGVDNSLTRPMWDKFLTGSSPAAKSEEIVSPLITTKWSQGNYYNSMCPESNGTHAQVGCGAMVMGQVMRYWRYPSTGTGSNSYVCNFSPWGYGDYGTLSVDFSTATYDYDNMPDKLNAGSTAEEVNAVATLLYHCGVAVNMTYGPVASSCNSNNMVAAMSSHFGYPQTIHYYERASFPESTFINGIRAELNESAPFFYGGSGSYGGHVWMCDGYRDDDYYHMVWGWGGGYDGWFLLSHVNPGPYDFNSSHAVIIGIRGPELPDDAVNGFESVESISLYPNPANNVVNIVADNIQSIVVYDLVGNQIFSADGETSTISTADWNDGIYLIKVVTAGGIQTKKVIINH